MKILLYLLFLTAALPFPGVAQQKAVNALSLELGKTGMLYNLVYDRKGAGGHSGYRLGAGSNFGHYLNVKTFGGGVYRLFGKTTKFFELGADLAYLHVDRVSDDQYRFGNLVMPNDATRSYHATLNLGYRSYARRTLFRAGIAPGWTKKEWLPGGYLSLGWHF